MKDGCSHVFVENTSESNVKVEAGTFLGRAGAGRFQPSREASGDKKPYSWTFTRITDYKKDIAKHTNGNVILTKDKVSVDKPVILIWTRSALEITSLYQSLISRSLNVVTLVIQTLKKVMITQVFLEAQDN